LVFVVQPVINDPIDNITEVIDEGINITLTCEVTGYPLPTVMWSKINETSSDIIPMENNSIILQNGNGSVSAQLRILNASRDDIGVYTCSANNSVGNDSRNVRIIISKYTIIVIPYTSNHLGGNFHGSSLKLNNYVGKTFMVENLRPGGTMLCVDGGQCQYSRKIFTVKTFAVSKNP